MNCTICGKDVNEHNEGRSCDRCVAEKLGWNGKVSHHEGTGSAHGFSNCSACFNLIPHYSSPDMDKETWELVERMKNDEDGFELGHYKELLNGPWNIHVGYMGITAPTPTLAICRAFLAMEDQEEGTEDGR